MDGPPLDDPAINAFLDALHYGGEEDAWEPDARTPAPQPSLVELLSAPSPRQASRQPASRLPSFESLELPSAPSPAQPASRQPVSRQPVSRQPSFGSFVELLEGEDVAQPLPPYVEEDVADVLRDEGLADVLTLQPATPTAYAPTAYAPTAYAPVRLSASRKRKRPAEEMGMGPVLTMPPSRPYKFKDFGKFRTQDFLTKTVRPNKQDMSRGDVAALADGDSQALITLLALFNILRETEGSDDNAARALVKLAGMPEQKARSKNARGASNYTWEAEHLRSPAVHPNVEAIVAVFGSDPALLVRTVADGSRDPKIRYASFYETLRMLARINAQDIVPARTGGRTLDPDAEAWEQLQSLRYK